MRITIRRTAVAAAIAGLVLVLAGAVPAQAATGVRGHLDAASVVGGGAICLGGCGYDGTFSKFFVKGWAYNPRTKPAQDVRIVAAGTFCERSKKYPRGLCSAGDFVTRSKVTRATLKRTDVKRKQHLHTAFVGFHARFYTRGFEKDGFGHYVDTVRVCAEARDHGSKQAWRTIGCKTVHVNDRALPKSLRP